MENTATTPQTIDEYISGFPEEIQEILQRIRRTIRAAEPEAQETISYKMPTFTLNGKYLIYFGAYRKHIGFYPAPAGIPEFEEALSKYGAGKGTLKFPLDQPMPFELIARLVQFRAEEIRSHAAVKGKTKDLGQ